MGLSVVGAGLPRTGTHSLRVALERLLGGCCHHMSAIPGHPFDLGRDWQIALSGGTPTWSDVFDGYVAAVDWPASAFWSDIADAFPDAKVVLSVRDSAQTWIESVAATILPHARMGLQPDWSEGRDLVRLFERFASTAKWDDPATLTNAYTRHNEKVYRSIPAERLLVWQASEGWEPLCEHLGRPVPDEPFPHFNKREDWG